MLLLLLLRCCCVAAHAFGVDAANLVVVPAASFAAAVGVASAAAPVGAAATGVGNDVVVVAPGFVAAFVVAPSFGVVVVTCAH